MLTQVLTVASTDAYLASVFSLAKVAIAYILFRLDTAYFIFYLLACIGTLPLSACARSLSLPPLALQPCTACFSLAQMHGYSGLPLLSRPRGGQEPSGHAHDTPAAVGTSSLLVLSVLEDSLGLSNALRSMPVLLDTKHH